MNLTKTDRLMVTLGRQIVSGKYLPGAALPAEADLCEEFATSRNIIREVFRSLEAKRLIEMKRYRGAFVAPRSQWNFLDSDAARRMKRKAAPLRLGHQLRWVKIESTSPYSTASAAERKRSRSVSRSICSRDWPV